MWEIVWLEIKDFLIKNIKIFLLSVLAFTFSCIAVNITLTNFMRAAKEQAAMEENYGNKNYYKINLNGDEEVFSSFFGGDNAENIKNVFEQLNQEDIFDYRYEIANGIEFFNLEDSNYGKEDFPRYPQECVYGYEEGSPVVYDDYVQLKGILADRLFQEEPNVRLSAGRWFKEEEFLVQGLEDIHLPVILGAQYNTLYQLGDLIEYGHLATEENITFEVIGFFEEDSYFYDNNNEKVLLNRYMVVPSVETAYNYVAENGEIDKFFRSAYDSTKIMNARIICDEADAEIVKEKVNRIFMENQLYELRLTDETGAAKKVLAELKNLAWSCMIISIFVIGFSVIVYMVQMYYKVLQNKRKYSVFLLNGITKKQIFLFTVTDTFLVFVLADILFLIFWIINASRGVQGLELTRDTFVVIPLMELFILVIMGILGTRRIAALNVSSSLRNNE